MNELILMAPPPTNDKKSLKFIHKNKGAPALYKYESGITLTPIPKISIHPNRINLYNEIHWSPVKPMGRGYKYKDDSQQIMTNKLLPHELKKYAHLLSSDKKTHGKVSVIAKRKASKIIEYLLFLANDKVSLNTCHGKNFIFKIAFVTLTLPSAQIHTDKQIKDSCLNQLLIELRKFYHVKNYFWRAEKQVNGNIHFHILVDKFIPWSELRNRWNRIVNKLGYCDRYRDEMLQFHSGGFKVRKDLLAKWDYKKQIKAYSVGKANDWNSPNSTDIHSLALVSKVSSYILKYCLKSTQSGEVSGRLWGSNEALANITGAVVVEDSTNFSEIDKIIAQYPENVYYGSHFCSIALSIFQLQKLGCTSLFKSFADYCSSHFAFNLQSLLAV
jgi:hypothetical protein